MIITRKGNFDSMHRVMNHGGRCKNIHGHTYLYEIQIDTKIDKIGYGMDFADVKKVISYYIDGYLDHGAILNPADTKLIDLCKEDNSQYYVMGLDDDYVNPSAENISKEMMYFLHFLFQKTLNSNYNHIHNIRLYETPNCYVDCNPVKDWNTGELSKLLGRDKTNEILDGFKI